VSKFAAGDIPVLRFRIAADRDLKSSYDMLERNLKRRIERLPGVSRVDLEGVEKKRSASSSRRAASPRTAWTCGGWARSCARPISPGAGNVLDSAGAITSSRKASSTASRTLPTSSSTTRLALGDIADIRYELPRITYERHLNRRLAVGCPYTGQRANLVETRTGSTRDRAGQAHPEMAACK